MRVTRRTVVKVLSVAFGLLGLNAWAQVVQSATGNSSDPPLLVALQCGIGLTGALTAWGGWRGERWAWMAAVAYGVVPASMLGALPFILDLKAEERSGIWTGAGAVLVFSLLCAWYFRARAVKQSGLAGAQQAPQL